jgi:endogenous inhibitor of DNA gyrase (YacG/DUF329 family)
VLAVWRTHVAECGQRAGCEKHSGAKPFCARCLGMDQIRWALRHPRAPSSPRPLPERGALRPPAPPRPWSFHTARGHHQHQATRGTKDCTRIGKHAGHSQARCAVAARPPDPSVRAPWARIRSGGRYAPRGPPVTETPPGAGGGVWAVRSLSAGRLRALCDQFVVDVWQSTSSVWAECRDRVW